jgi:hypothetical protein
LLTFHLGSHIDSLYFKICRFKLDAFKLILGETECKCKSKYKDTYRRH